MPKTSKIVTATQLKNVGLKTIAVGGVSGLYFRNRPYQSYFFLRFQDKTGRHDLTLGTYPEMSLAKAREEASRLRARISAGENVIAERKQVLVPKQPTVPVLTFEQVAKQSWDEGTKNGPDRSALLGHNFVYQETKSHGFYSSYFHQRISS